MRSVYTPSTYRGLVQVYCYIPVIRTNIKKGNGHAGKFSVSYRNDRDVLYSDKWPLKGPSCWLSFGGTFFVLDQRVRSTLHVQLLIFNFLRFI